MYNLKYAFYLVNKDNSGNDNDSDDGNDSNNDNDCAYVVGDYDGDVIADDSYDDDII